MAAKRFTDTGKWADPWFLGLSPKLKSIWLNLCDTCDTVGIWKVSLPLLGFHIGEPVSVEDLNGLGRRIVWLSEEKIWLPGFIPFQYGTLKPGNKAHLGIMRKVVELTKGLPLDASSMSLIDSFKTLDRGSSEGRQTPQEEEEEEEKEKVSLEEGSGEKPIQLEERTEEILARLPLITRDTLVNKYPPEFLKEGLEECVSFHLNEPGSAKWQPGVWGKKATTWMIEKARRAGGVTKRQTTLELIEELERKERAEQDAG